MNIKTWLNYDASNSFHSPDPVSTAVPDMSYSLRDLVERFTTGTLPTDLVRDAMYTDNPDFDDFIATELGDFDLSDYTAEIEKLRVLHSIRQERLKSVNAANPGDVPNQDDPAPGLPQQ